MAEVSVPSDSSLTYGDEEQWGTEPPNEPGWYWGGSAIGKRLPVEVVGELEKINDFSFKLYLKWRVSDIALNPMSSLPYWGPRIGKAPDFPDHIKVLIALEKERFGAGRQI